MKKLCLILVLLANLCFGKDHLTGLQIIQKMKNANSTSLGLVIKGTIEIQNLKTGYKETRSYISLTTKINGLMRSLFRFTDSTYRGTTFLTKELKNGKNIQYLYLSSIGSPRQISASDKEKNFLDTDLANEDLGGFIVEDYSYKRLDDKTVNRVDCYVIERYPKNKKSKYKKHLMVIDKKTFLPIMVKSYDKGGRLLKIMKGQNTIEISKGLYILKNMQVIDLGKKHKTKIAIRKVQEKKINSGYFNKNRMNFHWQEEGE